MGGFEPPIPFGMAVFETAGLNHSPTSPCFIYSEIIPVTLPGIAPGFIA